MRRVKITCGQASSILQKLVGLKIDNVEYRSKSFVQLFLGRQFRIESFGLDTQEEREQYVRKETTVYDFVIRINTDTTIQRSDKNQQVCAERDISNLIGQIINDVHVTQRHILTLRAGPWRVLISPHSSGKEAWRVFRPETEEDVLQMKDNLYRYVIHPKRWSADYPAQRDLWHPFPLTDSDAWEENKMLTDTAINTLQGMRIVYFYKSKDMNLFNIGFSLSETQSYENPTELHITSSVSLTIGKKKMQFWGDSDKEKVEQQVSSLIGQSVERVYLLEKNNLHIACKCGSIEVITADDNRESWRLIVSSMYHVAAANTWLGS